MKVRREGPWGTGRDPIRYHAPLTEGIVAVPMRSILAPH
jgi:hypothetical protein